MTLAFWTTWLCAASLCLWVGITEDKDAVIWWHVRTVVPVCLVVYAVIGLQSLRGIQKACQADRKSGGLGRLGAYTQTTPQEGISSSYPRFR